MKITFPLNCTTEASRMAWCYRAQEKLRLLHNWMSSWSNDGITENIYNKFPQKIKNRYAYKPVLTEQEKEDFYKNLYTPFRNAIIDGISTSRETAKNSDYWTIDFDGDIG